MRSRLVSVREAGILFVAVLMTAVYVYAILLASSPERDPVPALPSPWRLVDTIGRVIVPANPPEQVEAAPEAAGGAPVVASSDGVGGSTSAAFEPAGEVAAGRVAEVRRDVRSRDGVAPRKPADPAEPTARGRGRGSGKGHAKKESGPRSAQPREKRGA
ncbi:MAG: hypothetical protein M3303_09835, partial [Gemmatimonadota bacterium]|nr:hypothetical protein [Gemmatimonadota bacterium]